MMRLFILLALLIAPAAWGAVDPAPAKDTRMARELEARAFGAPRLAEQSERPELALALAELGLAASQLGTSGEGLGSQDYDALYSLLQRYRDDLLKMGLESSDLDAQLKTLKLRSEEMAERLAKLKPRDGLKIHARMYTFYDDMHLLGNAAFTQGPPSSWTALSAPLAAPLKPANQGVRYRTGGMHTELRFEGTRGPLSGHFQMDISVPWGLRGFQMAGERRIYVEMRLPVTMQFGDIDTNLTPLTLWRNDRNQPFEPEPFKARELRLRDDMLFTPDKWTLPGGRLSTDLRFFDAFNLELSSTTFIAGNQGAPIYTFSPATPGGYAKGILSVREQMYGEAWRAALPLFGAFTLSNNGILFWDETASTSGNVTRGINASVYSGAADLKIGLFHGGLEYALASYSQANPVSLTALSPLTGTALTYFAGLEHKNGYLRAFGRMVDNSFFAPGAQGRTIDQNYQYFGYFMTENSQINNTGGNVLDPKIQGNFATRLNDVLIPPGTASSIKPAGSANQWLHLLAYSPMENIDPYGAASPNRAGYGVDGEWKLFGGFIKPKASYEVFNHVTAPLDSAGNSLTPFVMSRMRGGLFVDFKPLINWPLRFSGGYTADSSVNGQKNAAGKDYGLTSTLMEGGAEWDFKDNMGINFGYRHNELAGFNEIFTIVDGGVVADTMAGGLWWEPLKDVRFDAVYTQILYNAPKFLLLGYEMDQSVIRMTVFF